MNPVVHFEMAYEDRERAKKFYTEVFGWKTEQLGSEMGNYVVVQTDETDEKGMLKETNRINGGLYEKNATDDSKNHPSVVIAVENLEDSIKKIKDAGGQIQGEPMDIPGIGQYISMIDTEGNRVGVLQPIKRM
jgi:uncharacterized protein